MMEEESSECLDPEENKNGSESKETVSRDCENEVKELGSNGSEDLQISDGQKPEEKENAELLVEEGDDGESGPEFFNMEDFEVVDVVDDEEDGEEIQSTSPSQISGSREEDTTQIRHEQSRKTKSSRSHKHQDWRDRPHNHKSSLRSTRKGKRLSTGSSRSHRRADSKERLRRASLKDKRNCDQAWSLSEKSSDKRKHSGASHKEDTKRSVGKERSSSHRLDHRKQDRHHSDCKRRDDKKACDKEGGSDHRKRESQRTADRQGHLEKNDRKKSCPKDQQKSEKGGSDKCRSDKKMKDKENSDEKNVAKKKQTGDEKIETNKDNSEKLNEGISGNDETSVSNARLDASCELTRTICETSCMTSSASLERNCTNSETSDSSCEITTDGCEMTIPGFETLSASHDVASDSYWTIIDVSEISCANLDKTKTTCIVTGTSCELTGNEDHETIEGVQEPKKNNLKAKSRCKNDGSNEKTTSDTPLEKNSTEEDQDVEVEQDTKDSKQKDHKLKKTTEGFEVEDFESRPAADSHKQEHSKFKEAAQVSKEEHLGPKQAVDNSEQEAKSELITENVKPEVPKINRETKYSEQKVPKSEQAANEFRQNPKSKVIRKDSRHEDPKFNQTAEDSNCNDIKSEEKTEDSKHTYSKTEQVTKGDKQKDSVETPEDCKGEGTKSGQADEVSKQANPKAEEGVKDLEVEDSKFKGTGVDSGQGNESRQVNDSCKQKTSTSKEDRLSKQKIAKYKQVAEGCKEGESKSKQETDHCKMKNMKQKEKNVEKGDAECKQETDDIKEGGIVKEDGVCEVVSNRNTGECKEILLQDEPNTSQPAHHELDNKGGQTEDKTATCGEQANLSDDMKDQISRYIEMIRKEVDKKEAKEGEDPVYKKVIGRPNSFRFSKVIIIGDSRIKHLENTDLMKTFDNLEIKCVPCLTIDNLQEAVDLHVLKKKYPQGILLICSVGIYNIIGFCTNISCEKDHKPMEQIYIKNCLSQSVIDKMRAMRIKLQKMLGKDSEVFFTTIFPVNIKKFITRQISDHIETTGHAPVVRLDWSDLENTVYTVTKKFNYEVMKLSLRKDGKRIPWNLLNFSASSWCQKTSKYLENGLDPTKDVTLEYMVPIIQYNLKLHTKNRYENFVLIGDSRIEIVAKNWPAYKWPMFTILTQPRLCFRDLCEENAIVKEIVGIKDSLIVISLGMYDFVKYETCDGCKSHKELEMPCLYQEKSDSELWNGFIYSLKKADQVLRKITSNCEVIITTIYPFDFVALKNFEIQRHVAATGHVVKSSIESKVLDENLNKIRKLMESINILAVRLAKEKELPVWDLGSLVGDVSHIHSEDAQTLFDGANPSSEMANRIAEACVSYAEASLYLRSPFTPENIKDVAYLENRLFTRVSNISSLLERNDFTLHLSPQNDEEEGKKDSDESQMSVNKRCKYNKNLISIYINSASLKIMPNLDESEGRKSSVSQESTVDGDSDSEQKHDTKISSSSVSLTQSDVKSNGKESNTDKQKNINFECISSKSPLHDSVSPTPMGSSPSANVSPFSEISCASSKTYLESISPASMSLTSPYSEGKCKETDEEKEFSLHKNHSPTGSCGSVRHSSQERTHHSFQLRRYTRRPSGNFSPARSTSQERSYSSVRNFSLERNDSCKRKHSLNRSLSPMRCHSSARYRSGDRYFSPEINYSEKSDRSPTRSPSWARYDTPNRNYSMDREDTYDVNHSTRSCSPARHSSEERHYISERGDRIHSPKRYSTMGSDRSRELYDSRQNEWQYSPDRHFSPSREQHSSYVLGGSNWEDDLRQEGSHFSHDGQHNPPRRDGSSCDSRSPSRCPPRKKKRQGSKSKDSITMRALESLREVHVRECDMYRQNPAAHPDYNKEYWAFTEKKSQSILSLGGDPYTYDMSKDWEMFWPNRLQQIFNESWASKRDQCISMLISNRGRSRSSSSCSSNFSQSLSRSSDRRNYSRNYHKNRTKYSKSPSEERERIKERCKSREKMRRNDRNRESVRHYKDIGELKQEEWDDMHRVRNRKRKRRRNRNDEHFKEAKPTVSETVQEHNLHTGARGTANDPKKMKGIFNEAVSNATERVNPGKVYVAPLAALWTPFTLKETAVTGQTSDIPVFRENLLQSDVLTDLPKAKRNRGISNDSRKGKTSTRSGKETPNDPKDFENQHSCLRVPPVRLEDLGSESVENAQKVNDLTQHKTKQLSEEEVSSTTPSEGAKSDVIDVLEILSRLDERLGALLVPVQLLHEKALELKSSGLDTMKIFDEIDNKILLHMTGDRLRTALKGDGIPIIQKVIIQEGEQRLSLLLEKEKERSLLFDLNIDNIASACLGKSSADTITFIENALLYHGYTEVSKDQLKKIHMAVKKEQLRIMDLGKNSYRSGSRVVNQSSESLEQPENLIHQDSSPPRHSDIAPCSSMPPHHSGSALYSPSHMSVSSDDSLPSLPPSPSFEPLSHPHAPQRKAKPVPSPFSNATDFSRSPVDGRNDVTRGNLIVSECHSLVSVPHTTDFGSFDSRMNASSSFSFMYDCHSSDSKASMMPSNYPSSRGVSAAHSVIPNNSRRVQKRESRYSSSKESSKKPIKITLPKPPAPRVFVRAFNPLGEDESESEES